MKKKKVLIIDDEEGYVALEKYRLEANGYEVITSTSGDDGIKTAIEKKPDAIVLDIMMPLVNGYQVCFYLKSVEKLKTPIIMVTALGRKEDIEQAKKLGADDYIIKPYESKELVEKVARLVSKK